MATVVYVQIGIGLVTLLALLALLLEHRRGRRVGEGIRDAVLSASEADRAHREAMIQRAAALLRVALDEGRARGFGTAGTVANDTSAAPREATEGEPRPEADSPEGGEVLPFSPPKS